MKYYSGRRVAVRSIWKGKTIPATKPDFLTGHEWAAFLWYVQQREPLGWVANYLRPNLEAEGIVANAQTILRLVHDASTRLLQYYAFEERVHV